MLFDWQAMWLELKHFIPVVIGMVIYSIAVFKFYLKASQKHLFKLDRHELAKGTGWKRFWLRFVFVIKYIFISPIILFAWFVLITILLLLFTSKTGTEVIMLIGLALLATIRVTAYYDELCSVDIAKTLPLSMLAAFILDVTTLDLHLFWDKLKLLPTFAPKLLVYFLFIVILEFVLRIGDALVHRKKID